MRKKETRNRGQTPINPRNVNHDLVDGWVGSLSKKPSIDPLGPIKNFTKEQLIVQNRSTSVSTDILCAGNSGCTYYINGEVVK